MISKLLGIDLDAILRADDELLTEVLITVTTDFLYQRALANPPGMRSEILLDEAHALLNHEVGQRVVNRIFRIGRSLGIACTVITQSIEDFQTSDVVRTILNLAHTKLILGLGKNGEAVAETARVLQLNETQRSFLEGCGKGPGVGATGLLLVDGTAVPLFIKQLRPAQHNAVLGKTQIAQRAAAARVS